MAWAQPTTKKLSAPFHGISVEGPINVVIHQTSGPSYAIARGDSEDFQKIEFFIQNDLLRMNVIKRFRHYPVYLEVWVNNLHQLIQRGEAKVAGHHLRSSGLGISSIGNQSLYLDGYINLTRLQIGQTSHVEIKGIDSKTLTLEMHEKAYAKLQGTMNICNMNINDDAWLSMFWVKANRMDLRYGGHSFVQLAGRVNVLDLELYDYAKFAGRYLRIDRAFVRTHDFSVAQIVAERSQHTLALDGSHIDFYNLPKMKADFMVDSGAVLDLREWMLPYMVTDNGSEDYSHEAKKSVAPPLMTWFASIAGGAEWGSAGKTQEIYLNRDPSNPDYKTFLADQKSSGFGVGEIFLGIQKYLPYNFYTQLGISGVMAGSVNLSGDVEDYSLLIFENWNFQNVLFKHGFFNLEFFETGLFKSELIKKTAISKNGCFFHVSCF
jgi:hypothetical protein